MDFVNHEHRVCTTTHETKVFEGVALDQPHCVECGISLVDIEIRQDIADWLGISLVELDARIAEHRESKRIAALREL